MKPGATIQPLESVRDALKVEVQTEFLKFIENLHTRMLVADVEHSLTQYAEKYSKIVRDKSVSEDDIF